MNGLPWHREALAHLLAQRERMPHAVLIHGARGIGKAQFARALGAALLCEQPRGGLACGQCPSCHWLSQGNHPDYREIVPEAALDEEAEAAADPAPAKAEVRKSLVIKVEQIRAQADFMTLTTHRAGFRILIVRPAEDLNPAAANALLKTLEEPPPATLIALVSDRPAHVLATLRSRCRSVPLQPPPRAPALQWLREQGIAEPETVLACAGGSPLLARDLAAPEEMQLRKRVLAELVRPGGADPVAFAVGLDRQGLERTVFWMQTWVADLVRLRCGASQRHHLDAAGPARTKARGARLEALLDLDRELLRARRFVGHPLNARLVAEHLLSAYNRATS